jgi:phosphatidylinositol alpha-1,6-mannosyltransferase
LAGRKEEIKGWRDFDAKQKFKIYRVRRLRSKIVKSKVRPNIFVSLYRFVFNDLPIAIYVMFKISYIIAKDNIDIVCLENPDYLGWASLLSKYVFRKKTIFYLFGEELISSVRSRVIEKPRFFYLSRADELIVISKFTKKLLSDRGIGHKTVLIYPGMDMDSIVDEAVKSRIVSKYNLSGKRILLSISRLDQHKGIDNAIRAIAVLKDKIPDILYLIGGEGREEISLRKLTEDLGVEDTVKFLGLVSKEELAACYELCDIFILANKQLKNGTVDGFGMVFIEAGGKGKPVIGGRVGGVSEAIIDGETGILVNTEDIDDLKNAILRLLNDPELARRLGENGRRRAAEFCWDKVAEKFKKVCQAL